MKISELQLKDVVNIADGRKLGKIHDLELDMKQGMVKAVVVPGETRFFGWFAGGEEWVIPWNQVVKIGSDVILVRLEKKMTEFYPGNNRNLVENPSDESY